MITKLFLNYGALQDQTRIFNRPFIDYRSTETQGEKTVALQTSAKRPTIHM